jgi:Ca2+-binding EF-hand superfamily protein
LQLKDAFFAMDLDNNGSLSLEELQTGIQNLCLFEILQENHVDTGGDVECYMHVMEMCDTDGDGKIDYIEFIQAAIDHRSLLNKQNI